MENRPSNPGHVTEDATGTPDRDAEPEADAESIPEKAAPTSNDVGKQTLTKADMGGRDVTVEGVPDEELASPRHPDDPSGDGPDAVQEV